MPEVHFINEDKKINVDVGSNLRDVAITNNINIYSNILTKVLNCRGNGMCGTCTVKVESEDVDPQNANEKKKLKKRLTLNPNLRLACQLIIKTDLKIDVL